MFEFYNKYIMRVWRNLSLTGMVVLIITAMAGGLARAGSISISPLRSEIELKPGETTSGTLRVQNTSRTASKFELSAETFNVVNENYDYEFATAQDLPKWITFKESSASIEPGKTHSFNYSVGAPAGAEGGAKYIVIFASTANEKQTSTISSVERAGMLLYINVPGKGNNHRGELLVLKLPKITFHKNASWSMRIKGTGNAHFRSKVNVKVRNIFGKTISSTSDNHLIMPMSTRALNGNITFGRWPGLYRVNFNVGMGDNPAVYKTKWIVYLPPLQTALISIMIIALVIILFRRKRKKLKENSG